ncbi:MAG: hypothetical protein ACKO37_09045 [Vampirovibrionales bacterium]
MATTTMPTSSQIEAYRVAAEQKEAQWRQNPNSLYSKINGSWTDFDNAIKRNFEGTGTNELYDPNKRDYAYGFFMPYFNATTGYGGFQGLGVYRMPIRRTYTAASMLQGTNTGMNTGRSNTTNQPVFS